MERHSHRRLHALLTLALSSIRHDRWLLALLRQEQLWVLMDSEGVTTRILPLGGISARCLDERRPVVIRRPPDGVAGPASILYAPLGLGKRSASGLLAVGTFADHHYTRREVEYVAALAKACLAPVAALDQEGLDDRELAVARLAAQGLSVTEACAALGVNREQPRQVLGTWRQGSALGSPGRLADSWPLASAASG
jgi:hypothetical protein